MQYNLADLYESLADAIGERLALVSGEHRLSFAELDTRANRVASYLRSRGVGAGDHVGLHLYNGHEFVESMLGVFKLRAVPINLNYRYVAHELRYLVDNADLVAVVTEAELVSVVREASDDSPTLTTVMVVGAGDGTGTREMDYERALAQSSPARDFGPRSGDDLYIIYTGGTTGMPKGVMWRHEDVFFAGLQGGCPGGEPIETPEQLAENAKTGDMAMNMLPAAPFIHGAAQWGAWIGLFTGGTLVLQAGRSFDPKRVVELISEEQVSVITLVGDAMARPIVDVLADGDHDTESLVAVASAGAILSPSVRDRLQELLADAMVLNNFGSTETGHQGSAFPGQETGVDGRPSFAMDDTNTVFDEDYKQVEPGSGKIGRLARGHRIPLGYYKDPEKTAERFVEIDGKRWSLPGDFATIEADGRITVYGRGAMCINTGGEKVFPEEVEEVLKSHPSVFDALVVGVADEQWMQRVAAVVQLRDGHSSTLADLQAHCRERVAGYKVPRELHLVDTVARQPSGKPDYAWAKRVAQEGSASAGAP